MPTIEMVMKNAWIIAEGRLKLAVRPIITQLAAVRFSAK